MEKEYVKMFANCIPVKGYKQSFIVDLQRPKNSNAIPNSLFEILEKHSDKTIEEIKNVYSNKYNEIIDDYFQFLINNEFVFKCSIEELKHFPKLDLLWKSPSIVENSIIDISDFNIQMFNKIVTSLSNLRCNALEVRFENEIDVDDVNEIGTILEGSRILSVVLILKHGVEINHSNFIDAIKKQARFQKVMFYNYNGENKNDENKFTYVNRNIKPSSDCGNILSRYFAINISTFSESQHFNTCLNRKVCIDSQGYIKNCPSMEHHYGHISNTKIEDVVNLPEFQKWWHIKKDDIDVCKDCEFRHMCTDCRAFIKDPENIYSQPAKCTYNPYKCKWEGEEGYVPVEQCGTYSRETGYVPDKKKIKKLNKQIWGDE